MRKNRNSSLLAAALLLALALAGCSKTEDKSHAPAPNPAASAKPGAVPNAKVQKQISSVSVPPAQLDFHNRTDPFKPYAPVAPVTQVATPKGEQAGPRVATDQLPIQSFEVSRFKVAGIVAGLKENRALIVDPNGKGYVVQQGMQIGNGNGHITRITSSGIEVVESFKNEQGKTRKRTIVLTLAKKR
jgi:type IV pilus assembly protein PilP